MDQSQFRPAREFALNFGMKAVLYGPPGSGKTPIAATTSPRPLLVLSEPGALTLRKCNVPTVDCFTSARIKEFYAWAKGSNETKNFDTFVFDSWSQQAEIIVKDKLGGNSKGGNKVDGRLAYGEMSAEMLDYLLQMFFMPRKHIVGICKMQTIDQNGFGYCKPYFPGKELNVRVPHLFDMILKVGMHAASGDNEKSTIQCKETFDAMARDRSGALNGYEFASIQSLITKVEAALNAA